MTKEQAFKNVKRLQKYLDAVKNNLASSSGELHEFWKREAKRTLSAIEKSQ